MPLFQPIFLSLPAWGAWIEIIAISGLDIENESLPAWGAWIEIPAKLVRNSFSLPSLPAWGAWIEITIVSKINGTTIVAPRMGSVD